VGALNTAAENIPEPVFLNDLAKLCYGPKVPNYDQCYRVRVKKTTGLKMPDVVRWIRKSIRYSTVCWTTATEGDLFNLRQQLNNVPYDPPSPEEIQQPMLELAIKTESSMVLDGVIGEIG
jgi:hypothetical protein